MNRTLFYIATLIVLAACKPSSERHAQPVAHAIEYDKLECLEEHIPDTIRRDTLFHITTINADRIIIDSIRVNIYRYPEHTLRIVQYKDSTGATTITCLAIFRDGSYQQYKEYCKWYYTPSETITHAQRDTLTYVRGQNTFKAGAWIQKRMLLSQIGNN